MTDPNSGTVRHNLQEFRFDDRNDACEALGRALLQQLRAGLERQQRVSMAVAGGTTPAPLYQYLSTQMLAWERVDATLTDERWVPLADPQSNEAMLRATLAREAAVSVGITGLYSGHATPQEGCAAAEARIRALARPFEVVVLGMGTDGHTASWFPASPDLDHALGTKDLCAAVRAQSPRITLTATALLDARLPALLIFGAEKWAVYRAALANGDAAQAPVATLFARSQSPLQVYWAP